MHHTCAGIDVARLVKDEIADAVVYWLAIIILYALHCVGVMAYQAVGSGVNETSSLHYLLNGRTHNVLGTPMQTHYYATLGVVRSQLANALF